MPFQQYEIDAIHWLVGDAIDFNVLESALVTDRLKVKHTGVGYFATVTYEQLPKSRQVFSGTEIAGRFGDIDLGFVVFVENHELTLECFTYDDELPDTVREQGVSIVAT